MPEVFRSNNEIVYVQIICTLSIIHKIKGKLVFNIFGYKLYSTSIKIYYGLISRTIGIEIYPFISDHFVGWTATVNQVMCIF